MPPASLPALAAIKPGPRTASAAASRPRRLRKTVVTRRTSLFPQREPTTPAARQDELEHVVDGHDSLQLLVGVDDADHGQVVVRHQASNLLELRVELHDPRQWRDLAE